MPTDEEPLPSIVPAHEPLTSEESDDVAAEEVAETAATRPARPSPPPFKISVFVYAFLGMLGLLMVIDTSARNAIATLLGISSAQSGPFYYVFGFQSQHLLATMAVAGAIEMLVTALAYNYTTDWIKQAKVSKWSAAFRKVQMDAIRSGKKDRIAALKPHQERLTRLSAEVSIAQFKGMAITWFLLILIYTWIGLLIENAPLAAQNVSLGGTIVNIYAYRVFNFFPLWFFIFSLYTIPASLVFRRILKNYWLRRRLADSAPPSSPPALGAAGGSV